VKDLETYKVPVSPRTQTQEEYIRTIANCDLTIGAGPAGTGKTFLAVAVGVAALRARVVDRIIISRPAVEAGEQLGYLPGDMREKLSPYLRPIYDALHEMLPDGQVDKFITEGKVEVAPVAFMRGRTLSNAFVLLDEAQNVTVGQMKMFLTRLGEDSKMVITGDPSQSDLPADVTSGLGDAIQRLWDVSEVGIVQFSKLDVVRHPLVEKIIEAYDDSDKFRSRA
jgi:phosphate starvation-inducible PhoH-like protein